MPGEITIIDYGMGNLRSVQRSFQRVGADAIVTSDPEQVERAKKLVLPGVGHYESGIERLKRKGLWDVLNDKVLGEQAPILGICLGMQLMTKHSDEGNAHGFGWIEGNAVRFSVKDNLRFKVPRIGWNTIYPQKESRLLDGVTEDAMFYFLHSYYVKCDDPDDVLATTFYEEEYTSAIQKNNIYATQFHPEKSHEYGDQILKNFLSL
jgi:imidazole glycerol-phosphate synthase subunit HisH